MNSLYYDKYIKYKNKYLELKKQQGGISFFTTKPETMKTLPGKKEYYLYCNMDNIPQPFDEHVNNKGEKRAKSQFKFKNNCDGDICKIITNQSIVSDINTIYLDRYNLLIHYCDASSEKYQIIGIYHADTKKNMWILQ